MPEPTGADRLAERLNWIPVSVMAAGFLAPVLLFWGAVFGPLRPADFATVSLPVALLGASACIATGALGAAAGDGYFSLRPVERDGSLYRRLGIRRVRRWITNGDWINGVVRARYPGYRPSGGRPGLAAFEAGCLAAERGHLCLFLGGAATAAFAAMIGEPGWFAAITLGNLVGNGLPIALQRYNRGRVRRLGLRATCLAQPGPDATGDPALDDGTWDS